MSNNIKPQIPKGVFGKIIDQQKNLDRRIIRDHDLFDENNNVDLTANFDELRNELLKFGYAVQNTIGKYTRTVGAKWWKNLEPMTQGQYNQYRDDFQKGTYLEEDIELSNISMKNIAIIQELLELEEAVKEGKTKDEIHDEFIDIIHFVVSLGIDLGIDSEQRIQHLYEKKNRLNHQRQDEHY